MKAELLQWSKKDGANVHVAYVIYEGITLPSKLIITKTEPASGLPASDHHIVLESRAGKSKNLLRLGSFLESHGRAGRIEVSGGVLFITGANESCATACFVSGTVEGCKVAVGLPVQLNRTEATLNPGDAEQVLRPVWAECSETKRALRPAWASRVRSHESLALAPSSSVAAATLPLPSAEAAAEATVPLPSAPSAPAAAPAPAPAPAPAAAEPVRPFARELSQRNDPGASDAPNRSLSVVRTLQVLDRANALVATVALQTPLQTEPTCQTASAHYGIGRAESNAIRLGGASMSRLHARLEVRGHSIVLVDCQSTHGTGVLSGLGSAGPTHLASDGHPVTLIARTDRMAPNKWLRIPISFGTHIFFFCFHSEAATSVTSDTVQDLRCGNGEGTPPAGRRARQQAHTIQPPSVRSVPIPIRRGAARLESYGLDVDPCAGVLALAAKAIDMGAQMAAQVRTVPAKPAPSAAARPAPAAPAKPAPVPAAKPAPAAAAKPAPVAGTTAPAAAAKPGSAQWRYAMDGGSSGRQSERTGRRTGGGGKSAEGCTALRRLRRGAFANAERTRRRHGSSAGGRGDGARSSAESAEESEDESAEDGIDSAEGSDSDGASWHVRRRDRAARLAVEHRVGPLLEAEEAAARCGYQEVRCSLMVTAEGEQRPIKLSGLALELPSEWEHVPYDSLRAFDTGTERGLGVCCTQPIRKHQIVGEACGRVLSDAQYNALVREEGEYIFSFDDEMLERKRLARDELRYIDLREYGNLMRLLNDEQMDPPLRLVYWPPAPPAGAAATEQLPQRIFLQAARAIPALAELTWDYGEEYYRSWLMDEVDCEAEEGTDSEADWVEENWACCDKCEKWRRLPAGPEYCDAALPEKWFCYMNPNTHRNSCDKREERMGVDEIWEGAEAARRPSGEREGDAMRVDGTTGSSAEADGSMSRKRAPGVPTVVLDSFLANQSDSSDSEETREEKRANRAELKRQRQEDWVKRRGGEPTAHGPSSPVDTSKT